MMSLNIFLVLIISQCALSENLSMLTEPCEVTDLDCISRATQNFLDNTSVGIPQYDILKLDPLTIDTIEVIIEKIKTTYHNLTVIGFNKQKLSHFTLNKDTKEVHVKTKIDFTAEGDLLIEVPTLSKSANGKVKLEASTEGGATYNYKVKTDDKGVEHYYAGPETISCEIIGTPKYTLAPELENILKDDDVKKSQGDNLETVYSELRKQAVCSIVEKAYATYVHNIRAAAKIVPKKAYFKNV
ncbi:hemolymph juvenile hormone binding protein [Aphomia sociella]